MAVYSTLDFNSSHLDGQAEICNRIVIGTYQENDVEFLGVVFRNVNFNSINLIKAEFQACTFENCDFSKSRFIRSDFSACTFTKCSLKEVEFLQCDMEAAEFPESQLDGTVFQACIMTDVKEFGSKSISKEPKLNSCIYLPFTNTLSLGLTTTLLETMGLFATLGHKSKKTNSSSIQFSDIHTLIEEHRRLLEQKGSKTSSPSYGSSTSKTYTYPMGNYTRQTSMYVTDKRAYLFLSKNLMSEKKPHETTDSS